MQRRYLFDARTMIQRAPTPRDFLMSNVHPYLPSTLKGQRNAVRLERSVRVALVGGFKPIKCGIATFTTDVHEQMRKWLPGHEIDIYAMVPTSQTPIAPEVFSTITQHDPRSYTSAANRMNDTGVDVVWIQHEFGIYGGDAGWMVLELIDAVAAPVIITLHTVLQSPTPQQRAVMDRMKAKASMFMVMSSTGRDILLSTYGVEPSFVQIIEHGAPDRPCMSPHDARAAIGLTEQPTIMTFGLLGPGKGLETAIRAMPGILRHHPDVIYRIVGATHPNLLAAEGEAYRDSLKSLATDLGVERSIEWVERFLDSEELLQHLASCDIYLTPYPNLAQSTSGTLAYAVALGCAVISTPYVHAREILANGVGILVPPNEPDRIAAEVGDLFSDRSKLLALRALSYARGRQTVWFRFAARCGEIIAAVLPISAPARPKTMKPVMPSTQAFLSLVDDVGILQHSIGIVPDRRHGYCIDDNARALILVNQLGRGLQHLAPIFAAFLQHGWNEDQRRFRNFMGYDRRWLEHAGSEDSNGRTVWALGHTARAAGDPGLRAWAVGLFNQAVPHLLDMQSPRAMAFMVLGAEHMLAQDISNVCALRLVARCAERFASLPLRGQNNAEGWTWFEDVLSYDNARVPQALFALSSLTGDRALASSAAKQLSWLCSRHTTAQGFFRPAGSEGFGLSRATLPFDQQPLEAWAMIDACSAAMAVHPCEAWRAMANRAYGWYLSVNDRGVAIGDPVTGRCHDGLMAQGLNANTGAESVLSFSLAYQSLIRFAGGQAKHAETVTFSRAKTSAL
jgi:glycosyltransferase involved in cell wall biosynthesis